MLTIQVQKEIEEMYNVETKIIVKDFDTTQGYDEIQQALKDLDVGVLINNVGRACAG